jgi:hypothetical protein
MGRKGTPLDWSKFDAHALARLGRIPVHGIRSPFGEQLSGSDLIALGFAEAARAARDWS